MTPASVRQKGQNAERDVARLLQPAIDEVYRYNGQEPPQLSRNLNQTQNGGFDLVGIPWLALEVKHHAKAQPGKLRDWWNQTIEQAGEDLEPVLVYRSNGVPFRVRWLGWWMAESVSGKMVVDTSFEDFEKWFKWKLHFELLKLLAP